MFVNKRINIVLKGSEPWSSGYGRHSCSRGRGFESQKPDTGGTFFTLICCTIVLIFV